jgi:hypothetical protein
MKADENVAPCGVIRDTEFGAMCEPALHEVVRVGSTWPGSKEKSKGEGFLFADQENRAAAT